MDDRDDDASLGFSSEVLARLVGNHREFLGFLERRLGSRAEAEDVLQEAFVKGAAQLSALRDDESAVAWFYRSLRNAVIDQHRRRGSRGRALEAFARELEVAVEPPADVSSSVCACVTSLSETLKPEYADALRRIDVEGISVKSYATERGIEANNAGVRVHRARQALRKRVQATCGTCAEHGCLDCICQNHLSPSRPPLPQAGHD